MKKIDELIGISIIVISFVFFAIGTLSIIVGLSDSLMEKISFFGFGILLIICGIIAFKIGMIITMYERKQEKKNES